MELQRRCLLSIEMFSESQHTLVNSHELSTTNWEQPGYLPACKLKLTFGIHHVVNVVSPCQPESFRKPLVGHEVTLATVTGDRRSSLCREPVFSPPLRVACTCQYRSSLLVFSGFMSEEVGGE
jgi:hypothetical protein